MGEPWIANFCGCCASVPMCCFVMDCPIAAWYLNVYISAQVQHNFMMPYCMVFCFGCFGAAFNRMKLREEYNIEGNYCFDLLAWYYCPCCSSLQEYRESIERYRKKHQIASSSNLVIYTDGKSGNSAAAYTQQRINNQE